MKNTSLEGLRGIAAMGVLLAHLLSSLFPYLGIHQVKGIEINQFYSFESILIFPPIMALLNGGFGVSVFFVLSGYVLTRKFFQTDNYNVLQLGAVKRYPRLIFPSAISVLFAWVLLSLGLMNVDKIPVLGGAGWPYGQYSNSVSFFQASYDAFIGAALFGSVSLNNPLWTIQVELLGSLFLFASYALFGKKRILIVFVAYVIFVILIKPGQFFQIYYYAMFAGSLLNLVEAWLRRHKTISIALFVCGWILGGFDYSSYYMLLHTITFPSLPSPLPNLEGQEKLIFISIGSVLLVAGTLGSNFLERIFNAKFSQFLGKISYSSYLLHWPIICSLGFGLQYVFFVKFGLSHLISSLLTCSITIPVIFFLAAVFTRFVDIQSINIANFLATHYWKDAKL